MSLYIPVPGHPFVRVEVQSICAGVARIWYIGDREHLVAAGVADDQMLMEWLRRTGQSSRPRGVERTYIDRYWHYSGAGRVQRFRVLMVRTLENARQLPGFRGALAAYRNRMRERDDQVRSAPGRPGQQPVRKRPPYLRLVIDNTRHAN
jgi:hypothetical protein